MGIVFRAQEGVASNGLRVLSMSRGLRAAAAFAAVFAVCGRIPAAQAITLASSARQLPPGSLKLSLYYQGLQNQHLDFQVGSAGPCAGGGTVNPAFPCGSSGDVPARLDGGAVIFQAAAQPWEGLQYYASAGLGTASMGASNNWMSGDRPGFLYGAGAKAVLLPDTIVSPGVALDGRLGWERYYFNELQPAGTRSQAFVNEQLDIWRYQLALEVSHQFNARESRSEAAGKEPLASAMNAGRAVLDTLGELRFEPYGGVKWLRSRAVLKDFQDGRRLGGIQDSFAPFLGLMVPVYDHEGLFGEVSFVNGAQYAMGLNVRFK